MWIAKGRKLVSGDLPHFWAPVNGIYFKTVFQGLSISCGAPTPPFVLCLIKVVWKMSQQRNLKGCGDRTVLSLALLLSLVQSQSHSISSLQGGRKGCHPGVLFVFQHQDQKKGESWNLDPVGLQMGFRLLLWVICFQPISMFQTWLNKELL